MEEGIYKTKKKIKKTTVILFIMLFLVTLFSILYISGKKINQSTGLNYEDVVKIK